MRGPTQPHTEISRGEPSRRAPGRRTLIAAALSLAAVASLSLVPAASASDTCDRVAAPNGSDSEPGTAAAPFRTAHKLVGSLGSGQTGCLRSGTYSWSGDLAIRTPGITVTSYPGEGATLAGRLRVEATADDAVIEGLILDGRNANDHLSPLIYADRVVLRDNEITNSRTGICVSVDDFPGYPAPREVVISDNRIHDCGQAGTNQQHAIYLAQARDTVIRDNWIYRNADRGIQLYPNADGTLVTGNVIDSNGEGIIFGGAGSQSSDDNLVKGNVITNSTIRYNVESYWSGAVGTGNVVRDNCVWTARNSYDGTPEGSGIQDSQVGFSIRGNVIADPRYVDRAAGDFTLQARSRCDRRTCSKLISGSSGRDVLLGTRARDRLRGRGGGDRITGRRGRDCLKGGPGGDVLKAADGRRDAVRCGGGVDTAIVDPSDKVSDCERVRRRAS